MTFANPRVLMNLVQRHKSGAAVGIYSVCSSNRFVIQAAMKQATQDGTDVLIEATCNQVNQFGGYSGLTPAAFAGTIREIAAEMNFPEERILLGGDHLGPFPWRALPADEAMANATAMVRAYAEAGFGKLHLDTSMACAGDGQGQPLDPVLIAERSASLCRGVEQALHPRQELPAPVYVVGTDIPLPGGAQGPEVGLEITSPQQVQASLDAFRLVFARLGLSSAWERVAAVVVQPGVDFGDETVHEYDRQAAAGLSRFIELQPSLIYEAHSTDYQRPESLLALVVDHFAILKVGPALTFALREALFALAHLEAEWLGGRAGVQLSGLIEALDAAMLRKPEHWSNYYRGDAQQIMLARKYSRSDRIRYYWRDEEVVLAVERLLANLERQPLPLTLLSQYLPIQYQHLSAGQLENRPVALIHDDIMGVLQHYALACGQSTGVGNKR